VTYSTFDPQSSDVLRLDFVPQSVTANGRPLVREKSLPPTGSGFTFDEATHVLRIRHDAARDIDIQGIGGSAHPLYLTFDNPHLGAGTVLEGAYPSGVIDWPRGEWKIAAPDGRFGTFNLIPADSAPARLDFAFHAPRIFVGIDVYNGGASEAAVTIRSENLPDVTATLRPGELRRVRTLWTDPASKITIQTKNGDGLRFDNLTYLYP
jgi:hypothetical protein